MKYLKQKLMAAAAMLMVSVVMLTSASYAWFTISVTPEVTDITTTITANENFEIALGTDAVTKPATTKYNDGATDTTSNPRAIDQTWGATITTLTGDDLKGLGPAKLDANATKIQTVEYGVDGRPNKMVDAKRTLVGSNAPTIENGTADIFDTEGNVIGQTILVWLRTNVTGAVSVDVSGVEFKIDTTDYSDLVKIAFERCTYSNNTVAAGSSIAEAVDATPADAEKIRTASLGEFTENTEVPVLIHLYLDGEAVSNAHIAEAYDVKIGSVKFTNAGITNNAGDPIKYANIAN